MIVITDGESHDSPDLKKVIEDCEEEEITRYAIAVSPISLIFPLLFTYAFFGTLTVFYFL